MLHWLFTTSYVLLLLLVIMKVTHMWGWQLKNVIRILDKALCAQWSAKLARPIKNPGYAPVFFQLTIYRAIHGDVAVSRGIQQNASQNSRKFSVHNCGPYWILIGRLQQSSSVNIHHWHGLSSVSLLAYLLTYLWPLLYAQCYRATDRKEQKETCQFLTHNALISFSCRDNIS